MDQSREALLAAWPLHSPEGGQSLGAPSAMDPPMVKADGAFWVGVAGRARVPMEAKRLRPNRWRVV